MTSEKKIQIILVCIVLGIFSFPLVKSLTSPLHAITTLPEHLTGDSNISPNGKYIVKSSISHPSIGSMGDNPGKTAWVTKCVDLEGNLVGKEGKWLSLRSVHVKNELWGKQKIVWGEKSDHYTLIDGTGNRVEVWIK